MRVNIRLRTLNPHPGQLIQHPNPISASYIYSSACPFACGLCTPSTANQQINTLSLAGAVTASPSCTPLRCAAGVTFNPVTCVCPCPTGFVDDVCSVYDCELGDKDSAECYGIDCSAPGSNIICPQTCFDCPKPFDWSVFLFTPILLFSSFIQFILNSTCIHSHVKWNMFRFLLIYFYFCCNIIENTVL